jgi:hypothetical protein
MNDSLKTEKIQVEKKLFFLDLKENSRGRFLRITEDVNGRRDAIILPASGLEDFRNALDQIIRFHAAPPDENKPEDTEQPRLEDKG